jgi:uncharacterized protein YcfJ
MPRPARIILFLVLLAGAAPSYAKCKMPREFTLKQQNGPVVKLSRIQQDGLSFDGSARTGNSFGDVVGKLSDKGRLKFTIDWGGSIGVYTGVVEDGDVQDGRTYDATNPESWSIWSSTDTISCQ